MCHPPRAPDRSSNRHLSQALLLLLLSLLLLVLRCCCTHDQTVPVLSCVGMYIHYDKRNTRAFNIVSHQPAAGTPQAADISAGFPAAVHPQGSVPERSVQKGVWKGEWVAVIALPPHSNAGRLWFEFVSYHTSTGTCYARVEVHVLICQSCLLSPSVCLYVCARVLVCSYASCMLFLCFCVSVSLFAFDVLMSCVSRVSRTTTSARLHPEERPLSFHS